MQQRGPANVTAEQLFNFDVKAHLQKMQRAQPRAMHIHHMKMHRRTAMRAQIHYGVGQAQQTSPGPCSRHENDKSPSNDSTTHHLSALKPKGIAQPPSDARNRTPVYNNVLIQEPTQTRRDKRTVSQLSVPLSAIQSVEGSAQSRALAGSKQPTQANLKPEALSTQRASRTVLDDGRLPQPVSNEVQTLRDVHNQGDSLVKGARRVSPARLKSDGSVSRVASKIHFADGPGGTQHGESTSGKVGEVRPETIKAEIRTSSPCATGEPHSAQPRYSGQKPAARRLVPSRIQVDDELPNLDLAPGCHRHLPGSTDYGAPSFQNGIMGREHIAAIRLPLSKFELSSSHKKKHSSHARSSKQVRTISPHGSPYTVTEKGEGSVMSNFAETRSPPGSSNNPVRLKTLVVNLPEPSAAPPISVQDETQNGNRKLKLLQQHILSKTGCQRVSPRTTQPPVVKLLDQRKFQTIATRHFNAQVLPSKPLSTDGQAAAGAGYTVDHESKQRHGGSS